MIGNSVKPQAESQKPNAIVKGVGQQHKQDPIQEQPEDEESIEEDLAVTKKEEETYEDDFLKSSGLVGDSARSKKNSKENSNSKKSGLQKFNSPMASSPDIKEGFKKETSPSPSLTKQEKKEIQSKVEEDVPPAVIDEEEDYIDDDFEADSQKSATLKTKQGDFQGTLSQSGLPPLASGKFNTQTRIVVEDTTSDNGGG